MKYRSCILLAAIALLPGALRGDIDFTPRQVRSIEDGAPMRRLAFREGEKNIFFQPPKGWQMVGGGNEIIFNAPENGDGQIRLGRALVGPGVPFDEQGLIAYRNAARGQISPRAQDVQLVSETKDAFPFDDWQSFEMFFSYTIDGVKRMRWHLVVTMNPQRQVRVTADATEKEFEKVHASARTLIGSWFEPPPGWPPPQPAP